MYNERRAKNYTKVTYELAFSYQDGTAVHQGEEFINMTDIGKYICWDEVGQFNGLVDTIEQASALTTFYAWSWLNGADPRIEQLPVFYGNEQINWVAEHRMRVPNYIGAMVKFSPNKHLDTIILQRTATGWKPANDDDIREYLLKNKVLEEA